LLSLALGVINERIFDYLLVKISAKNIAQKRPQEISEQIFN